jgi:hypothetical protein
MIIIIIRLRCEEFWAYSKLKQFHFLTTQARLNLSNNQFQTIPDDQNEDECNGNWFVTRLPLCLTTLPNQPLSSIKQQDKSYRQQ